MPFVRITLFKGRSDAEVRAIADGVHEALVATYAVPADDRFQVIERMDGDAIIYSPNYLGIHRTDGIVLIQIVAGHWRSTADKRALYRSIVDRLATSPGVRGEDVQVIITSNDKPDWSFGNGVASYVPEGD